MRLDLFYELSSPPHLALTESQVYHQALDEIELADRLGFGAVWLVEHHFMRGYSHSSRPELFLAAASQRTRRIRLGLGVIPLPYHHPVHVAERVASLDILSGGRLEVGIGRGFSPTEYSLFGADMAESRSLTEESLAILRASFRRQPISHRGRHYQFEQLDLIPHPLQSPPPVWTAAVSPQSFDWAAEQGLGVLAGPFKPWFMVKHDLARYRAGWQHAEPLRAGMTLGILCLPDGARAKALARPALDWFYGELFRTTLPVLEKLYPSYEHFRELGRFRSLLKLGVKMNMLEALGMAVVGSPSECLEKLAEYRESGLTHLLLAVGAGALPTEIVRESLQCLAEDVMPKLGPPAP
jgi:alkanesulfonate monooxygenase SsuD/methylene tetrahydromethanopterin reductase-like flavin-dependent oxidoreductase (luciferase family)